MTEMLTGAQIIVQSLLKEGVDVVFGVPGGMNLPTFDALYQSPINVVLTAHEQGASHMADGYSRANNRVGVCLATSGPGATNLVTGLATAQMDSVPIIAITGQVRSYMIGNDAFQEADTVGIMRPVVKHSYLVKDVKDLARTIKEAFHIATTGRPGPVLIDVPVDISNEKTAFEYPDSVSIRGYKIRTFEEGDDAQIKAAAEAISKAKKPLLYTGGGVILSGAAKELTEFARKNKIPVTTTLLGLGGFPETDPLSVGMLGMHGFEYANYSVAECDLLIAVGARFDDRVTGKVDEFAVKSKKIHIDVDPSQIDKTVKVDYPVVGDVKNVLKKLTKLVKAPDTKDWLVEISKMRKDFPLVYKLRKKLLPQDIIQRISKATKGNAILTTGVGQHQMWAAQFYQFNHPKSMITSGGLGTMGYGLPAAIGAQFARPDSCVWDIDGDGSFQMMSMELATAAKNRLPIKIALMNNNQHGMVRQWQDLFYESRYASSVVNPLDFVKLAEAYGCVGIRVEAQDQVDAAIAKAMEINDRPTLIEFMIEKDENVWPMVAPGKPSHQMIGTYESLKDNGAVAQPRRLNSEDESDLSLS